jgi:hypothetical protein
LTSIIYDWATRPDYLLPRLYPRARVVPAKPFVDTKNIAREARAHVGEGDLWFFHLNLSRSEHWLPNRDATVAKLKASGFRVINDNIIDVRKSTLQQFNRQLGLGDVTASPGDDPDMPVIVKTDYNYGGIGESQLSSEEARGLALHGMAGCSIVAFDEYYRCQLGQVSDAVWQDERLVAERYIGNTRAEFYRFYRCGRRAVLSQVINDKLIKKVIPGLPRKNWYFDFGEQCPESPEAMVPNATKMCEALGLEFGTLDIVVDDDECPYIIDVNPTPGWGAERQGAMLDFLSGGFDPIP